MGVLKSTIIYHFSMIFSYVNLNHFIVHPSIRPDSNDAWRKIRGSRHFVLEIIRRSDNEPGFKVLPRRWVVERTFGWMTRWKRLVRDYEQGIDVSEAMIHVAPAA
jgi:hypothetical protein